MDSSSSRFAACPHCGHVVALDIRCPYCGGESAGAAPPDRMVGSVPVRMEPGEGFSIAIVEQGWLTSAGEDLSSRGRVRVVIAGQVIASGVEGPFGISEGALGLLRTLESDHSPSARVTLFDISLVPHGCGAILMFGCPIGIDWTVEHLADGIRLRNICRHDDTSGKGHDFDLDVVVDRQLYEREIGAFAMSARELFAGVSKSFYDDFDREMYRAFWDEYDSRLHSLGLINWAWEDSAHPASPPDRASPEWCT